MRIKRQGKSPEGRCIRNYLERLAPDLCGGVPPPTRHASSLTNFVVHRASLTVGRTSHTLDPASLADDITSLAVELTSLAVDFTSLAVDFTSLAVELTSHAVDRTSPPVHRTGPIISNGLQPNTLFFAPSPLCASHFPPRMSVADLRIRNMNPRDDHMPSESCFHTPRRGQESA